MALLQMWPKISEKTLIRPELRIFYGFFNWKSMAKQNGDQAQLQLISAIEAMVSSTPGVKFIGRVSQDQLANEFLEASAWLYPTWFTETSCITAMEARAAGLNIVTSPIAALPETVGNYGVFIPGDWLSEEYQSQFIDAAVKALEGPPPTLESTAEAQMTLDWSHRVGDWEALFSSLEEKKKTNPLVPYTKARGFSR
jgi:glycosyltransferase involved in cell wall biosynthesis